MPINIKGNSYVTVAERIQLFHKQYPKGYILTDLQTAPDSKLIIIKAHIYPDYENPRCFNGYSQAIIGDGMINKTSALENAETSAVGRALGFLGLGSTDSIASADEVDKAINMDEMEICSTPQCGTACDAAVVKWSQTYYGKVLCREHQKSTPKLS
jgi:hypothetical protein